MRKGLFVLGAALLIGCGGGGTEPDPDENLAPPHPGGGQLPSGEALYPIGPFGVNPGAIIENYKFIGFPNAMSESNVLKEIQLSDFYNPTGTDVFPEGSPYGAGAQKPKALLIDVASVWCGPCNHEADVILPPLYAQYKPMGGEFLLQLADGKTVGEAATQANLFAWTQKYEVNYPAVYDPSYKLGALFEADAFPMNFIIKTSTMEIVEVLAGAPSEGGAFWNKYEQVMAGQL